VPKSAFPEGAPLVVGTPFHAHDNQGNPSTIFIAEVKDDTVVITTNHPLAGQTLYFSVKIAGLREASAEEQQHGHAHGVGGHHH